MPPFRLLSCAIDHFIIYVQAVDLDAENEQSPLVLADVITRNVVIGVIAMLAATAGIALLAGTSPGEALAIAAVPAVFGGPFIGGLLTMVQVHRRADDQEA